MKQEKISPITDKTLRHVGQSIDKQIEELIDKTMPYAIVGVMAVVMATQEWWRYYRDAPPSPIGLTILAVIVTPFCTYKIIKMREKLKRLRLGREGERAVGQFLDDKLRERGCKVFHDIVGDNFNIDHVVICTKGVFLIETKTLTKVPEKNARLYFNGETISIDNVALKRNPLTQVLASKNWLTTVIKESTGKHFKIKPVIVFPGWYVETIKESRQTDCWVLNPKALPAYIENAQEIMSQEDVNLVSYHLSRYIRVKAKELELKK